MQRRSKPAGFETNLVAQRRRIYQLESMPLHRKPPFLTIAKAALHVCVIPCSVCPTHLYGLSSFCLIPLIVSYHIPFTLLCYHLFIDTSYPASPLHNPTYCISFNLSSFPVIMYMHHFKMLVVLAHT